MKSQVSHNKYDYHAANWDPYEPEDTLEEDLWFVPGPTEEEPFEQEPRLPTPSHANDIVADWTQAEANCAARLAHVAGRLGALDDRLRRGPKGWRHRLALIEASELSWLTGTRIGPTRLALWLSLHLTSVQTDVVALTRTGWAVRRLTSGPNPEADLAVFLGRRDPEVMQTTVDGFADCAQAWGDIVATATQLHPITRAAMGSHLWHLSGLVEHCGQIEAAVTAARIAADSGQDIGFAPLAMGGARGLRACGTPLERLSLWLDGIQSAILAAMRHLDDIEHWGKRAEKAMAPLSGRTPAPLRNTLIAWPLVSAPMAEALTGASRAAVQRNLAWMEHHNLIQEVTHQNRFRIWKAKV